MHKEESKHNAIDFSSVSLVEQSSIWLKARERETHQENPKATPGFTALWQRRTDRRLNDVISKAPKYCLMEGAAALERTCLEPTRDRCTGWWQVWWGFQAHNCLKLNEMMMDPQPMFLTSSPDGWLNTEALPIIFSCSLTSSGFGFTHWSFLV